MDAVLLDPIGPHDGFSFDQLANAYNFRQTSDRRRVFSRVVIERAAAIGGEKSRVLDVGCGQGIGRRKEFQRAIRTAVGELWGIEPDPDVTRDADIVDEFQNATMENADLPENHFDVVYSYMVMEHVEDPPAFLRAVWRVLRPGGEYVFITPNGKHYFTQFASALHRLKLDEVTLRVLRRESEREYHYPVRYRFNDAKRIAVIARELGFETPRFAYLEPRGPGNYLPGVLKPVFWLGYLARVVRKQPDKLVSMLVVLRKPEEA